MRNFKDLKFNEKLLLALAVILIIAIILRWPQVKEGFIKGFQHFGFIKSESVK